MGQVIIKRLSAEAKTHPVFIREVNADPNEKHKLNEQTTE
jgi:hypothetical protein